MEARSTERQPRPRWTYAEFARLPEAGSSRYEIIADELVMTPAPGTRHQRISVELSYALHGHVRTHGLGQVFHAPLDVLFADGDFFEPDLVFIGSDRLELLSDRGMEGAPDLVVEILSPSTAARDRGIKLERYRLYGVAEYWIVDPQAERVEVWRLGAGAETPETCGRDGRFTWQPSADAPTLAIDLADLFRQ
ncbi:MAG: Uma2 family endonuclease [Gemmatimonadota bacterium]